MEKLASLIQNVANRTLSLNCTQVGKMNKKRALDRWSKCSEPAKAKLVFKRMIYILNHDSPNLSKRMEFLNGKKKYKRSIKVFKNNLTQY